MVQRLNDREFLVVGGVLILLVIGYFSFGQASSSHESTQTSLAFDNPTYTPFQPSTTVKPGQPTPSAQVTILPTTAITTTPRPTFPTPKKQEAILLLGTDKKDEQSNSFRTDVIILAVINTKDGTVNLLSIPRDLFVEIPGWGQHRINTAFGSGGFSLLADTFEHNFGFRPDHYVLVDYVFFSKIIDDLGGIDVQVGQDYCHRQLVERTGEVCVSCEEICVSKGEVHMDGYTATWYAQTRYTTSDFDRHRRQQELLRAIFNRFIELNTLKKVPQLYDIYKKSVTTDLRLRTILSLIPTAAKLKDTSRIHQFFIGPNDTRPMTTSEGAQVLLPRSDRIQVIIEDVLNQ